MENFEKLSRCIRSLKSEVKDFLKEGGEDDDWADDMNAQDRLEVEISDFIQEWKNKFFPETYRNQLRNALKKVDYSCTFKKGILISID